MIAPGYIKPIPSIHFYQDTSGSVSDHDLAMATHNGHPLNELADRLAVLARRNREMGVDEVTNARMIASIRQEAKSIVVGGLPLPTAA